MLTVNFGTSKILFNKDSRKAAAKLVSSVDASLIREILLNTRIPQCVSSVAICCCCCSYLLSDKAIQSFTGYICPPSERCFSLNPHEELNENSHS